MTTDLSRKRTASRLCPSHFILNLIHPFRLNNVLTRAIVRLSLDVGDMR